MINEHDDFEANSSVVLLTTFVFYIMLLCVLELNQQLGMRQSVYIRGLQSPAPGPRVPSIRPTAARQF